MMTSTKIKFSKMTTISVRIRIQKMQKVNPTSPMDKHSHS